MLVEPCAPVVPMAPIEQNHNEIPTTNVQNTLATSPLQSHDPKDKGVITPVELQGQKTGEPKS